MYALARKTSYYALFHPQASSDTPVPKILTLFAYSKNKAPDVPRARQSSFVSVNNSNRLHWYLAVETITRTDGGSHLDCFRHSGHNLIGAVAEKRNLVYGNLTTLVQPN